MGEHYTILEAPCTPEEGYNLEADMADKTITFVKRQKPIHPDKPWMAFYAPSGHKPPVGVPSEWIERYRGQFDDGYDELHERTLARQKEFGIVPPETTLAPRHRRSRHGSDLSDDDKAVGAHWMEVFRGAVESPITRSAASSTPSRRRAISDNTLIIYLAGDNGPTARRGACTAP